MSGTLYRHHRGGLYSVIGTAIDSTNASSGRLLVLYVSLTTGRCHARAYSEFHEPLTRDEKSGEVYDPPRMRFQRVVQRLSASTPSPEDSVVRTVSTCRGCGKLSNECEDPYCGVPAK